MTPADIICILARVTYWYGQAKVHHIDSSGGVFLESPEGKVYQALDRPLPQFQAFKEAK